MIDNFMIGMHGKYDLKKYNRDFRKAFYGIQACLIEEIIPEEFIYRAG